MNLKYKGYNNNLKSYVWESPGKVFIINNSPSCKSVYLKEYTETDPFPEWTRFEHKGDLNSNTALKYLAKYLGVCK